MNQTKRILLISLCFMLWIIPALVQASPFMVDNGKVYGHRGPNGTISLFAEALGGNWNFSIHKVFPPEGQMYYFISAELDDSKVQRKHLINVKLIIDGKNISLPLLTGTQPIIKGRSYQGYYSLPEEVIKLIVNAKEMSIAFEFDRASPETGDVKGTTVAALKKLFPMEKERYVREGRVLETTDDPTKEVVHPQIFIPNVTPQEVLDALVYETNFYVNEGKDRLNDKERYFLRHTSDTQVIRLYGLKEYYPIVHECVTVACRPYDNGVWVTLGLLLERYTPPYVDKNDLSWPERLDYIEYYFYKERQWGRRLHSVYQDLYGKVDYGFTYEIKDVKKGPFKVTTVDVKKFPELGNIKAGDLLMAIDGVPTTCMEEVDLEYWLDNGLTKPKTFTFKTMAGEEKKITIMPQVQLVAPETRKDYGKILAEKMSGLIGKDSISLSSASIYLESDTYDPLGNGLK